MIESIYQETSEKMEKTVNSLGSELNRIKTGRASLALLDGINVDYYGTLTPINQTASLAVPESRLITIQPWDLSAIKNIEKAILKSDMDLNPSNDGKIIRISIPPLTEKRRKDLVKLVGKMCEEHKVGLRNIRRTSNDLLKDLKKDGDIAEDDAYKAQEDIQKITDQYIKKIDDIYQKKEKEILEI